MHLFKYFQETSLIRILAIRARMQSFKRKKWNYPVLCGDWPHKYIFSPSWNPA